MDLDFKDIYLIFNFIIGTIYVSWIYWLIYLKNCKCSQTKLQHYIHIYWYVIFILDIIVFFNFFNIDHYYLLILGNLLGIINIYMTYAYMKEIEDCACTYGFAKDTIIIIYLTTVIASILFTIGYLISVLRKY